MRRNLEAEVLLVRGLKFEMSAPIDVSSSRLLLSHTGINSPARLPATSSTVTANEAVLSIRLGLKCM